MSEYHKSTCICSLQTLASHWQDIHGRCIICVTLPEYWYQSIPWYCLPLGRRSGRILSDRSGAKSKELLFISLMCQLNRPFQSFVFHIIYWNLFPLLRPPTTHELFTTRNRPLYQQLPGYGDEMAGDVLHKKLYDIEIPPLALEPQ